MARRATAPCMPSSASRLCTAALPIVAAMLGTLCIGQPAHSAPPTSKPETHTAQPAAAGNAAATTTGKASANKPAEMTMETFLDRLMMAESGGRADAKNSRSTALGPYQFIESTFIDVARRNFPKETEKLSAAQLLALRTDMAFSRKVATAYTQENANQLAAAGVAASFPHLRLAFFLGPAGAIRVLQAPPATPMLRLVSPAAMLANPYLSRLTAAGMIARSAREVSLSPQTTAGIAGQPDAARIARKQGPRIAVRCNLGRPSCRRWLALQTAKLKSRSSGKVRVARGGRR